MKTNKWLMGCAIGCVALVVLVVVGGWIGYRYYVKPMMSQFMGNPGDIGPPGVVKGAGLLTQSIYFSDPRLGSVTDIALGRLDPTSGVALGVAGVNGAAFLDATGNVKSTVKFSTAFRRINFVDVEGDGVCEFMERGSWGSNAALLNHAGKVLWTYGGKQPGVDDMAAGDLDGDGLLEFAVGFGRDGGLHLVGRDGKARWQRPDNQIWHIEIMDVNGDGRPEIVHSNGQAQLVIRDETGSVISQVRPHPSAGSLPLVFMHFSVCHYPSATSPRLVLTPGANVLSLCDTTGKTVAELSAPKAGMLSAARGVPVKLQPNAPAYFAAAVTFMPGDRSLLFLYDTNNALVYQEVLPETCQTLAALPLGKTGAEALLVGGEAKVWEYCASPGSKSANAVTATSSR